MSHRNRNRHAEVEAETASSSAISEIAPVIEPATPEQLETEPAKNSKVVSSVRKVAFLQPLIEEGKYSAEELAKLAIEAFPGLTESTIRTFLTDSKNPKYNKFPQLVTLSPEKKMIFAPAPAPQQAA